MTRLIGVQLIDGFLNVDGNRTGNDVLQMGEGFRAVDKGNLYVGKCPLTLIAAGERGEPFREPSSRRHQQEE